MTVYQWPDPPTPLLHIFRFEHPNKWTLVTTFGVRCEAGKPTLSGSRAFKKPSECTFYNSRFVDSF